MAKRKRATTKKQIEKRIKEDRGQNRLEQYQPWIRVQDLGSAGLVTRIKGNKIKRIHQLLSTLELDYFYLLDWSEEVIDIREQFPLDLEETLALANEIAIKHPVDPISQEKFVMTTDFLITIKQPIGEKDIARTIKYSKDLATKRVLEKFEIERLYWKERNIDWGIVTELDLNKNLVKNLKWLYQFRERNSLPTAITDNDVSSIANYLLPIVTKKENTLRQITNDCDGKFNLPSGNSLAIVRHLIATKSWKVNMITPIQPEKVLNFISENLGGKVL